jgi:hypothetical protein
VETVDKDYKCLAGNGVRKIRDFRDIVGVNCKVRGIFLTMADKIKENGDGVSRLMVLCRKWCFGGYCMPRCRMTTLVKGPSV